MSPIFEISFKLPPNYPKHATSFRNPTSQKRTNKCEKLIYRNFLNDWLVVLPCNFHSNPLIRSRMGNIRGFGGPLTSSWHERSLQLQHKILQRMRELGIIPVLPAFTGHVPRAFPRLFPEANVTKSATWNSFSDKYCW